MRVWCKCMNYDYNFVLRWCNNDAWHCVLGDPFNDTQIQEIVANTSDKGINISCSTCLCDADINSQVKWLFNGTNTLPWGTVVGENSLMIDNVTNSHFGQYVCSVGYIRPNGTEGTLSSRIKLTKCKYFRYAVWPQVHID